MSETKQEKAPKEGAKAPKDGAKASKEGVTGGALPSYKQKREKQAWSLERCLKKARRFSSEAEWQAGAPSSFKAAAAHGWTAQCKAAFRKQSGPSGRQLPKSA